MSHRFFVSAMLGLTLGVAPVVTQGCNPEQATLNLFRRQGLNLLKPARDYIKVGGLMVKGKRVDYIDPFDAPPGNTGGGSAFTAIILTEARQSTAGFDLAVGMVRALLPGSADVAGESNTQLKLDQINATGKRLTYQELDDLLLQPATAAQIRTELKQGREVFFVQEVYSAEEVQVSASDRRALRVKYGDGSAVRDCETTPPTGAKTDQAKSGGEKPGEAQGGKKEGAEGGKAPEQAAAEKGAATADKGAQPDKAPKQAAGQDASTGGKGKETAGQAAAGDSKPSVTFGLCRAGSYTLKFKSATPGQYMPFAVRLRQVEIRDGQLALRNGTVTISGALGGEEEGFNLIDDKRPEILDLQRRAK